MEIKNCIVSNGIISQASFMEAKDLFDKKEIPFNFSNNKELQDFSTKSLKENEVDSETYDKIIGQLDLLYLEYDEAVLLGVLELIYLSK